jgi:hypothetical protein
MLHDGVTLACFYILVVGSDAAIYRQTSTDGVTWSTPVNVIDDNASGDHDADARRGSPSVIAEPDGTYTMFSCGGTDTPGTFHRWTSPDTTTWTWQGTVAVQGATGQQIWHADVFKVGDTYHALFMSNPDTDTGKLYHFTSTTGTSFQGSWEAPSVPVSGESWDALTNYRSSLIPRNGPGGLSWDILVSGRPVSALDSAGTSGGPPWRIGLFRGVPLAISRDRESASLGQALEISQRTVKFPKDRDSWEGFTNETGSNAANKFGGLFQTTGANANSWAFLKPSDGTVIWEWYDFSGDTAQVIDWDQPFAFDVPAMIVATGTDAVFRFYFGQANGSVDSPTDMTAKGVGFRIENLSLKAVYHDGTSETIGDAIFTAVAGRPFRARIRNRGNGQYDYYVNGTLVGTVSDGPTGFGTQFVANLNIAVENGATASTRSWSVGQISYVNLSGLP